MKELELITLLFDFTGLVLISRYILSIPEPVKFVFNQEVGEITSLQPVADVINQMSRNFELIKKMRLGFGI